jgi:hypothetical protein
MRSHADSGDFASAALLQSDCERDQPPAGRAAKRLVQ